MGNCYLCRSYDNYFNAFFEAFKLKSVTDSEYVSFIEKLVIKYNHLYISKETDSSDKEKRGILSSSTGGEKKENIRESKFPKQKQSSNFQEIVDGIVGEAYYTFNEKTENASFFDNKSTSNSQGNHEKEVYNEKVINEEGQLNLSLVQEHLHKYMELLTMKITDNFCVYTNLQPPKSDELFPDENEKSYLNEYLVKKEVNKFFEYYISYYKKQGKTLQFLIALLFFTKTSYTTITKYLNKLFKLFFNIEVISEEGINMYINMQVIKEVVEIYVRLCSSFTLNYIIWFIPDEDDLVRDFLTYYEGAFSEKIITYFTENYFDYNFSAEVSLVYFIKVVYSKIKDEKTVRYSLLETYKENKSFTEKMLKELKMEGKIK